MNSTRKHFHNLCLVCKNNLLIELEKYAHAHLHKCKNCGFIFSGLIPNEEELIKHYTNYPRYNNFSAITIKRYNSLLDRFEKYRIKNNILDVGCSNGYFLEAAKNRGWNVYGQEYADECIDVCTSKGIQMKKGYLENCNFEDDFFDVITSFEVIEHLNTPISHTNCIYEKLRKGGVFYFTTPNFNSISKNILGEKWNIIEYPEHLSYFTPKTINYLLKNTGFKKISIKTTGFSISRLKQSQSKQAHNSSLINNPDEKIRQKAENKFLFKLLKNLINFVLNLFKKGDTIKGFYQKP